MDIAIDALMTFLRDKLFDCIIYFNKGKISSKMRDLRKRHKTALTMSVENILADKDSWQVFSGIEIYRVTEVEGKKKLRL